MQDPVSDMLTRIRNANQRNKPKVTMPSSKLKVSIAHVLLEEGYITGYKATEEVKPILTIQLKYFEGKPVIQELERISKPSLRKYAGSQDLLKVRSGLGIAIVSTSKGVMTDRFARASGIGGEVLCTVF
jgi:small subunit ribosomal protein S8